MYKRQLGTVRMLLLSSCVCPRASHSHPYAGFNDFNHVDCCTMDSSKTHKTNEASRVVGMHRVNFLGSHIVDASLADRGPGGSWCTCHLSSPEDVCHKQVSMALCCPSADAARTMPAFEFHPAVFGFES